MATVDVTTVEACVRSILCGLSNPLRQAVKISITSYRALLNTQLLTLQAKAAQYNVAAAAAQVLFNVANAALEQARSAAHLFPSSLISGCVTLGNLNQVIAAGIDLASADLVETEARLTRILSVTDEVNTLIAQIQAAIGIIDQVLAVVDIC